MVNLYRLLLRLYPKSVRDEFGSEMLAVFEAAQFDSGGGLGFLLREFGGVVSGVARERAYLPSVAPALAGVFVAAGLHWAFYTRVGRLLHAVPRAILTRQAMESSILGQQVALAGMALAAMLCIVPLVVILCRDIQATVDRRRLRPVR